MKLSKRRIASLIVIGIIILVYGCIKLDSGHVGSFDYMICLKEDRWKSLSEGEKIGVLSCIKEEQLNKLTVDYNITLQTTNLKSPVVGCYINKQKTILIDKDYLEKKTAKESVSVLCHEIYHVYQYYLIEYYHSLDEFQQKIPLFDFIEQYEYELKNYVNEGEGYKKQNVEIDANDYASKAILDYQF